MEKNEQRCSFCGKSKEEVRRLIAGPDGVFICDDCVDICKAMVDETIEKDKAEEVPLKKPAEIKRSWTNISSVRTRRRRCFPSPCITITSA